MGTRANMTPCRCGHYLFEHSWVVPDGRGTGFKRVYGKCTDHKSDGTLCKCIQYVRQTVEIQKLTEVAEQ